AIRRLPRWAISSLERKAEDTALTLGAFHIHVASVSFNDLLGNGEPKSCSFLRLLVRHPKELVKDPLEILLWDSCSRIRDVEADELILGLGRNLNTSTRCG